MGVDLPGNPQGIGSGNLCSHRIHRCPSALCEAEQCLMGTTYILPRTHSPHPQVRDPIRCKSCEGSCCVVGHLGMHPHDFCKCVVLDVWQMQILLFVTSWICGYSHRCCWCCCGGCCWATAGWVCTDVEGCFYNVPSVLVTVFQKSPKKGPGSSCSFLPVWKLKPALQNLPKPPQD